MMSDSDKRRRIRSGPITITRSAGFGVKGKGRLFYEALGHHESIYYDNPQMLEHILAGMQYALGDLKADDSPSVKPGGKTAIK